MLIQIKHIRGAGHCLDGARRYCNENGIDWRELVKSGVPEEQLLRTGNAIAIEVVEKAHGWKEKTNSGV